MNQPDLKTELENLQLMKRAVLKARARVLAKPHKRIEHATDAIEVIEFLLSGETYAVETKDVKEVLYLKSVTKLPSAPKFIVGVISLRGQIIGVIDIRKFFELPQAQLDVFNKVIIVEKGDTILGFTADEVTNVREIEQRSIHPSLPSVAGKRAKFLRGITTDRVTILDVERMLRDDDLIVDEQVED
ncbi:MAG TPA: chemotaxis protein CheW [Drouetiella sp.]